MNPLWNKSILYTSLFCLVYFTSYITRINYGTTLIEIASDLEISNALAGIPVSFSFMSYGIGQLIAGYLGDKFNSIKIISIGLATTALMNLLVGFTDHIYLIIVLWTINGLAQSLLWPPLVKVMLSVFTGETYKTCCTLVVLSSSLATLSIYVLVPLCIRNFSYHAVFLFSALLAFLVLFIWCICTKNIKTSNGSTKPTMVPKKPIFHMILSMHLLPVLVVIILQGMLRDGITTWMPSFIHELFHLSTAHSILLTSALPIFGFVALIITRLISTRIRNELMLSSLLWGISLIAGICLLLGLDNIALSILSISLLNSCMHGINLLLVCNLPSRFTKYGNVSSISGILNACTYVGSTISTFGFAKISEFFGWQVNISLWVLITLIGAIICVMSKDKVAT